MVVVVALLEVVGETQGYVLLQGALIPREAGISHAAALQGKVTSWVVQDQTSHARKALGDVG